MAASWFVRGGGKVYGPLEPAKLKQLVAEGKINEATEIAQNYGGPWYPAGRVKGLFPPRVAPTPQPPSAIKPGVPPSSYHQTIPTTVAPPPAAITVVSPAIKRRRGGYVESNLLPHEDVVYRGHLHWYFFLRPITWFALAFFLFRTGSQMNASERDSGLALIVIGVLVVLIAIASTIEHLITYWTSEFAVTNRRVIMKQGFIRRKTMELMLGKVDSLSVDQGILGRILGFGTVRVSVATENQNFRFLANPLEFRRQVQLHTPT